MSLELSPTESIVYSTEIPPLLGLFWLKQKVVVTNKKVYIRKPNTLLGLIPLGYREDEILLSRISSVKSDVRFSAGNFFRGLLWLILVGVGLFIFVVPIVWLLNDLGLSWSKFVKITGFGGEPDWILSPPFFGQQMEQISKNIKANLTE